MPEKNISEDAPAASATVPRIIPGWRFVIDQAGISQDVFIYNYEGSGTEDDPYIVKWIPNDARNPQSFSQARKWFITAAAAIATLAVALLSSAYTGGVQEVILHFKIGSTVATLGVSLFVLGFAIGPFLWAPLSELFGRQILFFTTYMALTLFCVGCAVAQNIETLLVCRFFAGAFGSSPLTNSGGIIADMFPASQRGLAMAVFAAAPFLGPAIGPIAGGFLGMNAGWRWVMGFLAAFAGFVWIAGSVLIPETYAPVILRARARKLCRMTGKHYVSQADVMAGGKPSLGQSFKIALLRPWILLFKEPIVLILSIYMSVIYGTLYMMFAAFPIVFQRGRGWNQGIGGLAFIGIVIGMAVAIACTWPINKRYNVVAQKNGGLAPPEARLPPVMVAAVTMPIGLFWFAWTNSPSIHWAASIAGSIPFGFGMVLCFLGIMNYLVDSYAIFAASVLAASSFLRSLFGAAFPLFTSYMYDDLGIHWASSIPAFLAVACMPFPFLFYKYGAAIRARCKFSAEAEAFMKRIMAQAQQAQPSSPEHESESSPEEDDNAAAPNTLQRTASDPHAVRRNGSKRSRRSSRASATVPNVVYDGNPYSIDRVSTRDSFA